MANCEVTIWLKLIAEDAEGLPCENCGDIAFLKQHRLWMKFAPGKTFEKQDEIFCSPCADKFFEQR